MYREIITPSTQEITLKIPEAYLNKRVEILVFEVNEGMEIPTESSETSTNNIAKQMSLAQSIMSENVEVLSKLAQ